MDYFIVKRFMYYVKLVWRNEMLQNISDGFEKFFCEIRDEIRQRHSEIIDDYVLDERIRGIENTSLALCEAKVEDEVIVFLLIKYWIYNLLCSWELIYKKFIKPNKNLF